MEVKDEIIKYLQSQHVQSLASNTRAGYAFALKDLERFCIKNKIADLEKIESILPSLCETFKRKPLSDQTIYQKFTCIKVFLKWAGRPSQYTFSISSRGKKAFKLKHARRWVTREDVAQCHSYIFHRSANPTRDRLITALLIETGCRAKELAVLRGMDIDMASGTLFLSDSKTEPRPGFFSRDTYKLMVELQSEVGGKAWREKIFPDVGRIQEIINGMLKDLGLKNGKDGRGPHVFRHYFASHLFFVGGMRIEEVAVLMGDTVDTVRSVYLHCPVDVLKKKTRDAMGWR